jgi:hypothetical protein
VRDGSPQSGPYALAQHFVGGLIGGESRTHTRVNSLSTVQQVSSGAAHGIAGIGCCAPQTVAQ